MMRRVLPVLPLLLALLMVLAGTRPLYAQQAATPGITIGFDRVLLPGDHFQVIATLTKQVQPGTKAELTLTIDRTYLAQFILLSPSEGTSAELDCRGVVCEVTWFIRYTGEEADQPELTIDLFAGQQPGEFEFLSGELVTISARRSPAQIPQAGRHVLPLEFGQLKILREPLFRPRRD